MFFLFWLGKGQDITTITQPQSISISKTKKEVCLPKWVFWDIWKSNRAIAVCEYPKILNVFTLLNNRKIVWKVYHLSNVA